MTRLNSHNGALGPIAIRLSTETPYPQTAGSQTTARQPDVTRYFLSCGTLQIG